MLLGNYGSKVIVEQLRTHILHMLLCKLISKEIVGQLCRAILSEKVVGTFIWGNKSFERKMLGNVKMEKR